MIGAIPGCQKDNSSEKDPITDPHIWIPLSDEEKSITIPWAYKPPLHLFFRIPADTFEEGEKLIIVDTSHLVTEKVPHVYSFGLWVQKKNGKFLRWAKNPILVGWRENPFAPPYPKVEDLYNVSYWTGKRYSELLKRTKKDEDPWIHLEGIGSTGPATYTKDAGFIRIHILTDYCIRLNKTQVVTTSDYYRELKKEKVNK